MDAYEAKRRSKGVVRPSRSEKDELKKAEIMNAAAECFMLRGYNATTIDQIADHYGSTKGLIYYHFRSKTDLFFQVYRRAIQRTVERATPVAEGEGTALERLRLMCQAHILGIMHHLAYHHVSKQGVELHMANALTPEQNVELRQLIELRDIYERLFAKVIADGLKDKTLFCGDVSLAARTILGALNGVSVWYRPRKTQTEAQREALASEVSDIIISGLIPRAGGEGAVR